MKIKEFFKRFIQEEEGATAVEYAVMIVLIIVACIAVVGVLGGQVDDAFQRVSDEIATGTAT